MIDRVRRSVAGINSAACRMPRLQTWSRSDRRISPSRWEQAGRTDCGEQPGQEQSAAASLEPGLTLTGRAFATASPNVQGRHLFFFAEDRTTGIVGSAMFFFSIGVRICRIAVLLRCGIAGVGSSREGG